MGNRFSKPEPAPERTVISIDDTEPWFDSSPVEPDSSPVVEPDSSPVEEIEIIFGTTE